MATMMIPTRSAQMTLHDKDYYSVKGMIDNARAIMKPGDIRVDTRCPVCGGTAWTCRAEANNGQSIIAACDDGCFICRE
jgi:hypothetical protein